MKTSCPWFKTLNVKCQTKRSVVFTKIAKSISKSWEDPTVGRMVDKAFKQKVGEEIPK
jgi:hypothetical protein